MCWLTVWFSEKGMIPGHIIHLNCTAGLLFVSTLVKMKGPNKNVWIWLNWNNILSLQSFKSCYMTPFNASAIIEKVNTLICAQTVYPHTVWPGETFSRRKSQNFLFQFLKLVTFYWSWKTKVFTKIKNIFARVDHYCDEIFLLVCIYCLILTCFVIAHLKIRDV